MRYLFFFLALLGVQAVQSQGSGFSFSYSGPSQILVGVDCEAPLDWGHPNTPTVMSNIPGGMIVSFDIYSISLGYEIGDLVPGGTTVTVFYQAIDNFGNSALYGFTISFVDLIPPAFDPLSLPPNLTVSCINIVPPPADVEAFDNCENENTNLTITFSENNNAQLCTGGSIIRTWVADDDLGNTAVFNQTITVTPDVTPPVITGNLVNGMAPCSTAMAAYTTWLNAQRAAFSATDAGCGIMTLSDNAPPPSQITSFCGVIEVTFSAKDNCNNTSTLVRTFTVTNNVAPVITNPASDANGNCNQSNIAQIFNNWINSHGGATATDDCSSIFWSTFPPNPSVNDTCDTAIEILFIAGDGCNNFDTTAASFTLTDDTPPAFTADPAAVVLSCSATTIDSTLMDWLGDYGHSAAHDLCTADNDLVQGYRIGGQPLSYEEVLEAWQDSLNGPCRDGVFIGGLGINNVKAYLAVEFTYTDKCGNLVGKVGHFGITDNGRPTFTIMPRDTALACAENGDWESSFLQWYNTAGNAVYTDLCSDVMVSASITADSAIQYLSAALDTACQQGVSVTIQFSLTDDCGNNSQTNPSASFSISDTIPPTLLSPALDANMACSENAQQQLQTWIDTLAGMQAGDGCGDLMWSFSWADTSGMIFNGIHGQGPYPLLDNLDCMAGVEVIFTGMDVCQNSISDTAVFSILDTLPPTIIIAEDSLHLSCQDTIPNDTPDVVDGCDDAPLITFTDSVSIDSCLGIPELVIRTWTATDACGNSSSAVQWFFRIDSIPPTFELPSDTSAFCSIDTLVLQNVTDNCDPAPVVTYTDEISGLVCNQVLTRTWIVSDACGNSASAIQQFDLTDDAPPVITFSPGHVVYTCDTSSMGLQAAYEQWTDSVGIEDGCSDANYFIALNGSYDLADTSTWPGTPLPDSIMVMCGEQMAIEGDLVAYDACGNVIVEAISFIVNDTTPPVLINCPGVLAFPPVDSTCDALVTLVVPSFEEVCFPENVLLQLRIDQGDTIDMGALTSIDTTLTVGIHIAEWIATDCNGNAGTCVTRIEIIDENALNVFCPNDSLAFVPENECIIPVMIYPAKTVTSGCGLGVITWSGFIEGMAEPSGFVFNSELDSVEVLFSPGLHRIFLIAQDSTADADTCSYVLEVRDTFPPVVLCQPDTVWLGPSGLDTIHLASTALLQVALDTCGISSVEFDPPFVSCSSNGQTLAITISVSDLNGNTTTCQSTLFVATAPLMPSWASGLCDDTLRLFSNLPAEPVTTYTYSWSGPNGFVSSEANPVIPEADTSYTGNYVLIVQSENGCTAIGTTSVLIVDLQAPPLILSADTLCVGDALNLTTLPYSGDVVFQWYQQLNTGDTLLGTTSIPEFAYTPFQPGTYTVYAVVSQDTCSSEAGIPSSFEALPAPQAIIAENEVFLCVFDSLFLKPAVIADSLEYFWTGPGGYEATGPTPPGIAASEIDSGAVYYLVVSNPYCASLPDSVMVTVVETPAAAEITGDMTACEGGTLTLSTTASHTSYEWIDPNGQSIITSDPELNIPMADSSHAGNWFLIVADQGCPSDTSVGFNVMIDTALQLEILTTTQVCEGTSITLTTNPSVTGAHFWSGPGGFESQETSPTTPAMQGTYTVLVQADNGCEANDSVDVTVDLPVSIIDLLTDADTCVSGSEAIHIWAVTQPGFNENYLYQWNGPGTFAVQDSFITIDSVTASDNGLYTLTIINGVCASSTAELTLDVKESPAAPVIIGDNVYCFGDSIILFIDAPAEGTQYQWSSPDTNVILPSPGTLIIPNATPDWTGVYTVVAIKDGCSSSPTMAAVQVRQALFPPSITSPPRVCEGDSLILSSTAPAGSQSHWISSSGFESDETQPVIFPVTTGDAGTYQVVYTLNGCESPPSNPYDIIVVPALAPPVILTDASAVCVDNPVPVEVCIDPASIIPGVLYTWVLDGITIIAADSPDTCISITGSPLHGSVNAITAIASIQGCPSPQGNAVVINGDEIPEQNADAGADQVGCPGAEIFLNATAPQQGTGLWTSSDDLIILSDPNDPQADLIGLPSGTYALAWTLSYATCTDYSQDSMYIEVLPSPEAFPDTVEVPFGQTTEFIVTLNDVLNMDAFTLEVVANPQRGNALHAGNGIFRYSPNVGFVGTDMMIYRICSAVCPEECSEAVVIIKVGNEDDCFVPSLFTPNDDGVNDVLIIPCLETDRYPDNKIIIFNEWGAAVYNASPYQNDWTGTYGSDPLPVGTYFYIMDFGDGNEPKRSFLIIER
jgi:gliding motility-associated-like protein